MGYNLQEAIRNEKSLLGYGVAKPRSAEAKDPCLICKDFLLCL